MTEEQKTAYWAAQFAKAGQTGLANVGYNLKPGDDGYSAADALAAESQYAADNGGAELAAAVQAAQTTSLANVTATVNAENDAQSVRDEQEYQLSLRTVPGAVIDPNSVNAIDAARAPSSSGLRVGLASGAINAEHATRTIDAGGASGVGRTVASSSSGGIAAPADSSSSSSSSGGSWTTGKIALYVAIAGAGFLAWRKFRKRS